MSVESSLGHLKAEMEKAKLYVQQALQRLRAGRARPEIVSHLKVEYYDNLTPLPQVASITTPDARSIHIKPWEKSLVAEIEKAIQQSDLGLRPQNNGETIILSIPPLTEERRKQIIKQAKQEIEQGRIHIRSIRKESNDSLKRDETLSEDDIKQATLRVQKLIDSYIGQLDQLLEEKEKEIMKI